MVWIFEGRGNPEVQGLRDLGKFLQEIPFKTLGKAVIMERLFCISRRGESSISQAPQNLEG